MIAVVGGRDGRGYARCVAEEQIDHRIKDKLFCEPARRDPSSNSGVNSYSAMVEHGRPVVTYNHLLCHILAGKRATTLFKTVSETGEAGKRF